MYIARLELQVGERRIQFRSEKANGKYSVRLDGKAIDVDVVGTSGLQIKLLPMFKGAPRDQILDAFFISQALPEIVSEHLRNTLYLGPFRQAPQRRYPTRGASPVEVGAEGEAAVTMLANEYVQTKTRPHLKEISRWLRRMGLAQAVDVERVGKSDLFDVKIKLTDGETLPIADLGYGLSQVLPVLVQLSFAPKGATLLFEQPELHLHCGAAQALASVLVEAVREKKVRVLAETHSRDLFVQLLSELRAENISVKDVAAYKVERVGGKSVFTKIEIEEDDGAIEVYDPWDTGLNKISIASKE